VPTLEAAQQGDGGCTPAPKRDERLTSSPPGDEPPSPAVRLRRFQLLEQHHSSGDTTVIDRPVTQQYCCVTGRSILLIVRHFPTFLFMPTVKWKLYPCVPVAPTV
jgi:hypothetical protein